MEENITIQTQFESYLTGDLPLEESEELEKELKRNPLLQEKLSQYETAYKILSLRRHQDLRMEVDKIADQPELVKRPLRFGSLYIAASLLLLIVGSLLYSYFQNEYSDSALFQAHFDPYPILDGNLSELPDSTSPTFTKALKAYASKDFRQSIHLLDQYVQSPQDQDTLHLFAPGQANLYLANALLSTGESNRAIQTLQQERQKGQYSASLEWYLALAYLKNGKSDSASHILSELRASSKDSSYRQQAKEILDRVDHSSRFLPGVK